MILVALELIYFSGFLVFYINYEAVTICTYIVFYQCSCKLKQSTGE